MQCACAVLSSVPCLALRYFYTFSHNGKVFEKKILNTKCEFWYSLRLLSEIILILRRNEGDMIKNVHWASCKVLVMLVRLWWNFDFLGRFSKKNTQIRISLKSVQWEPSCSTRTDRQTDRLTDDGYTLRS